MSSVSFVNQEVAKLIDVDMMGELKYSTDALMELAGLSVACAVHKEYPHLKKALVVCGPGNNGGDGLVAARHLVFFGWNVSVWYPKPTNKTLYQNLAAQCRYLDIPVIEAPHLPENVQLSDFDLLVDAIFGYSFTGDIRAPFDSVLQTLNTSSVPIASVDIPSGWDVERGNVSGKGLNPAMLVSLSIPKLCAKEFRGVHYLGGRFVPPSLAAKHNFTIPAYPGSEQCVRLE